MMIYKDEGMDVRDQIYVLMDCFKLEELIYKEVQYYGYFVFFSYLGFIQVWYVLISYLLFFFLKIVFINLFYDYDYVKELVV